ncbi:reduced folate carrier family protein [Mycobacterium ulcerans str. Harvey]|uniref:Reduced folate carrier family protein n=1 Tax=Mycobacterium ulcerans str. Harvey TaxID=1299332 RepID=A0ABP3AP63_MYCUL|nr:reduced folate carrier family protein [Mycobacterium ulcerans str. Harvey]
MGFLAQFRSFNRPSRVLMINQFGINVGFYMLMPYLADYLAGPLGLAAWAVGLVMGVRNFSQQGMFFVGGTLADRFGYKPLIVAGCLIRTGGFALLVVAQSLPSVLIAAAATGFAGALFNPRCVPMWPRTPVIASSKRLRRSTSSIRPGSCWARWWGWPC